MRPPKRHFRPVAAAGHLSQMMVRSMRGQGGRSRASFPEHPSRKHGKERHCGIGGMS
jgi:hypothetical protein